MAKVVFTPSGHRGDFSDGTTVLEAAQKLGVDLDSICGGRGLCGRCQVVCADGEFQKHGIKSSNEHLSAFGDTERAYEQRRGEIKTGRRLGCQARIHGEVLIDVPPDSQVHKQVVRKDAELRDIVLDPATTLHYVEVQEADMHDPKGDLERLLDALHEEWQLEGLSYDFALLASLQTTLRKGNWAATVAVHEGQRLIAIWPGLKETIYGIAVDVGSTTVAAHLCDLQTGDVLHSGSMMNPQIRYGEDLMSRVSYVMMHPEDADAMTDVVREGLDELVGQIVTELGVQRNDVLELTMVGNPVMHHILLGINPVELGGAPFALATDGAVNTTAASLGLNVNPGARVYVPPCVAGHVGADAASMVLAEAPEQFEELTLLVDVGTNAEIVLGNRDRLLACSSPTGPAFEGAQISSGQRAAPGAIERVRIDPVTLEPRYRIIGAEQWSDEPGFNEAAEKLGVTGICGSGIIEVVAEMFLAGIITEDGVIDPGIAERSNRVVADDRTHAYVLFQGDEKNDLITVTQNDVRQIQLAKAALYAGVKLLLEKLNVENVDRIRLAGAFGSHIDVKHAMVLGLIPDCELESVASAGNAAGTGARISLLNVAARRHLEGLVKQIEKIETALESNFQEHFVNAMAFPNKVDRFEKLFSIVPRPEPRDVQPTDDGRKRRRRRR